MQAKELARKTHERQAREGGGLYIIHPLRVAISLVRDLRLTDVTLIQAALLHDVIEDGGCTEESLSAQFGRGVAGLVAAVSRQADEKRPPQGDSSESPYFRRIRAGGQDVIALKIADKIDNLRDALYHPRRSKRQVLVNETHPVYGPLLESITDPALRDRSQALLRGATEDHGLASLMGDLHREALRVRSGERLAVPPACLDVPLLHYLLFNPSLACWLSDDGVQLTKSVPSPIDLACNVARKYAAFIEREGVGELLEVAGVPRELTAKGNRQHWDRVLKLVKELARLATEDETPLWCQPAFSPEASRWLFLLVHSLLFRPANWIFPMWHGDYGAALAGRLERSPYIHNHSQSETDAFHGFLQLLLISRQALWRLSTGAGTRARTSALVDAAHRCGGVSSEVLWSMRLLSEYLDVVTELDASAAASLMPGFTDVWKTVVAASFDPGALAGALDGSRAASSDVEIVGLEEVRELFAQHGLSRQLDLLLRLLTRECQASSRDGLAWISFDTSEFAKRQELFDARNGLRLDDRSAFADLESAGIQARAESADGMFVLRVAPAKRFALQNRLPELSADEREEIGRKGYSAVAIFDALVGEAFTPSEPVWVPRVYRVLDTIADLDADNVQPIEVEFSGPQDHASFVAYLPVPRPGEPSASRQANRKHLLARYIAAQIYNYSVTRRVLLARLECGVLEESRASHGFSNPELLNAIRLAEAGCGYRGVFGQFIESFNFSPFQISTGTDGDNQLAFGEADMRSGLFLGIDIGGTDVKFMLFAGGKPQMVRDTDDLGRVPTFAGRVPPRVDAAAFCERLILALVDWLADDDIWRGISGIGISWPGAVRENRIVCFSGTLGSLEYDGKGFEATSPAAVIHAFPFVEVFRNALRKVADERGFTLNPNLTLTLENDGNAEAFGNYCARVLAHKNRSGGKLVVKLGTSLAGCRVLPNSAIASEVGEFSKIVLDLAAPPVTLPTGVVMPAGVAREYVSSLAVRNLSRTFVFDPLRQLFEPHAGPHRLFGPHAGRNGEAQRDTRIEAVELGDLLALWRAVGGDGDYLTELALTDNKPSNASADRIASRIREALSLGRLEDELARYVRLRGEDRRWAGVTKWQRGWERLHWLSTGTPESYPTLADGLAPSSFPYDHLATMVPGVVALFSQVGLQLAHLVAALYNIYRRHSFEEVILAGGVLSGVTGELVKRQAEAFLARYYDKIYGADRYLPLDALQLADSASRDVSGPLGAAMLANRSHKAARLSAMRRVVDFMVRDSSPGEQVRLADVTEALRERHILVAEIDLRDYLLTKVNESLLIPQNDGVSFTRALETSPKASESITCARELPARMPGS
ncbi:MAG: hypothetical protein A3H96_02050 [Acidobacteria bacterium RIFCSPLOWO2_02_FULL_67_36]|nr:MAG: hypothetical protein A3H96_02050 [Acidobacteria bacterium RIFCSPLOWO2_02_FULL_67_36]OFW19133.1 MAG: hypothetical protein A3G21_05440 [Acidobacteria bacterium RIFCSPLOWO2_12_FULL_66_21]